MSSGSSAYIVQPGEIELNMGAAREHMTVKNTGDRAIQVGSHYHFFEVNPGLEFDREKAWGMHLAIPAGLAIRFEPGDEKDVELTEFRGNRILYGFSGLVNGSLDDPDIKAASMSRLHEFLHANDEISLQSTATPVVEEDKE